jgi:hypothetical protein
VILEIIAFVVMVGVAGGMVYLALDAARRK